MPLHSPPPAKAHEDIRGARAVVRLQVADGFWLPLASVGKANVGRQRGSGTRFVPHNGRYPHLEPICGYLGHPAHAKYRSVKNRCGRCGELKSCRPLFRHLPTLKVGKMWVHQTWVGDSHCTHNSYPRPTCRRSLLAEPIPSSANDSPPHVILRFQYPPTPRDASPPHWHPPLHAFCIAAAASFTFLSAARWSRTRSFACLRAFAATFAAAVSSSVRKATYGTGVSTGVLFAGRLAGSRFRSPIRSRPAD